MGELETLVVRVGHLPLVLGPAVMSGGWRRAIVSAAMLESCKALLLLVVFALQRGLTGAFALFE
jgi:hypothetical protein